MSSDPVGWIVILVSNIASRVFWQMGNGILVMVSGVNLLSLRLLTRFAFDLPH